MKAVVILLALLATANLGYHEVLFRLSAREALADAYRARAIDACQKDITSRTLGVGARAWSSAHGIQLVIDKTSLIVDVHDDA